MRQEGGCSYKTLAKMHHVCVCVYVSVSVSVCIYTGYTPSYSRGAYSGGGVSGGVGDTARYGGYANSSVGEGVGGTGVGSLYGSRDR